MKKLLISILLVNLLAACASQKPKEVVSEAPSKPTAETSSGATQMAEPAAPTTPRVAMDPLSDPNSILARRSVYFPFDVSAVQDVDKPIVEAHAKYLSEHAERKVRVEGNCDERGSDEYNLALGQRRADSVKKMLEVGGTRDSQVEAVSFGEAKSRAKGHDEGSWAQNRRADFIYIYK